MKFTRSVFTVAIASLILTGTLAARSGAVEAGDTGVDTAATASVIAQEFCPHSNPSGVQEHRSWARCRICRAVHGPVHRRRAAGRLPGGAGRSSVHGMRRP